MSQIGSMLRDNWYSSPHSLVGIELARLIPPYRFNTIHSFSIALIALPFTLLTHSVPPTIIKCLYILPGTLARLPTLLKSHSFPARA